MSRISDEAVEAALRAFISSDDTVETDLRAAIEAALPHLAPKRDREEDRKRWSHRGFNAYLDQAITENGEFTTWHQLADTGDAYYGYMAGLHDGEPCEFGTATPEARNPVSVDVQRELQAEFVDAVKQLCNDFSDRQNRPYMGDVTAALDGLLEHEGFSVAARQPVGEVVAYRLVTGDPKRKWMAVQGFPPVGVQRQAADHGWQIEYLYAAPPQQPAQVDLGQFLALSSEWLVGAEALGGNTDRKRALWSCAKELRDLIDEQESKP